MANDKSTTNHRWTISRHSVPRCLIYSIASFCLFLLLAVFVSLLLIYLLRARKVLTSPLVYPNFTCHSRSCGCPNWTQNQSLTMSKIVGGSPASPYLYPWLVVLTDRSRTDPFCAGFIISSTVVVTAAHCLINRQSNRVDILSILHDLRDFQGDRHSINQWSIHSDYRVNDSRHLNDIALIQINGSFADDVRPCCLPSTRSSTYPSAKRPAIVSGWGRISVTSIQRYSSVLQHVVMPIVDHRDEKCQLSIADHQRQMCAGYETLSIDSCSGDSGGPLLVVENEGDDGYFVAAGIVSYGNKQCDASVSSGVYTRVSFYLDWIKQTIATMDRKKTILH